jgi:hypothetical protein
VIIFESLIRGYWFGQHTKIRPAIQHLNRCVLERRQPLSLKPDRGPLRTGVDTVAMLFYKPPWPLNA